MRRWRERLCALADVIVTPNAAILPPGIPRERIRDARVGRRHRAVPARRERTAALRAARRHDGGDLRRRVPLVARRDPSRRGDQDPARRAARTTSAPCSSATAPSCRACARRPHGHRHDRLHRRAAARSDAGGPRRRRHRRGAVRHRRPRAAVPRLLLVAAEDLRVHGRRPPGGRARGGPDPVARRPTAAKGCCTIPRASTRTRWPTRCDADRRRRCASGSAPRRVSAPCATTAGPLTARRSKRPSRTRRHAAMSRADEDPDPDRRVSSRLRRQRLEHLRAGPRPARAGPRRRRSCSRSRGPRRARARRAYDGFRVLEFGAPAPPIPYVRNYYKSEKLTRSLAGYLSALLRDGPLRHRPRAARDDDLPAIEAAHAARVPAVATVRDYWPVCYWSDLLHTREGLSLCPACTPRQHDASASGRAPAPCGRWRCR